MTTAKIGVAMRMTIMVETTLNTVIMNPRSERGIVSSMVYTSFENRFSTRPSGVVSKKDMGECMILSSIELWSFLEARIPPIARAKAARRINRAWEKPSAA